MDVPHNAKNLALITKVVLHSAKYVPPAAKVVLRNAKLATFHRFGGHDGM